MSSNDQEDKTAKWRPRPCPACGKMSVRKFRPFCSKRCADIDLGRWFKGTYAIPGESAGEIPEKE